MTHEALGGTVHIKQSSPAEKNLCSRFHITSYAGAAAFAAMREYEKHEAANGNPPSHAFAKELLAGIAAAEVTFSCMSTSLLRHVLSYADM